MRGEWTGSIAYIFDQGNQRRDAVLRDVSGTTHYWATTQLVPSGSEYIDGDNVYTIEPILPSQTNPDGTYVEGTIDTNGWEYLGEQELFVAAKIAIFDESFVKNTINVGIPPAGNPNAQIAIAGGTDEPYISVGQTGVQGYGQPGAFIGVSNDFGGEGVGANSTSGILSLTGTTVGGKYNQLAWDGSTLTIKGAIRQTAEGIVESRNLGLWSATSTGFGFRFGDIVSNNNITWQCKLAHIRNTAPSTDAVAEPGGSGAYTTYWEESDLSAKSLRLSADTQIFRVAQNGTITPSTITLTANRQNIGSSTTYSSSPSITVGGSGDTATITPAQFGSNTAVTFTATAGGFEDEMTIVKLQEGTDAITVVNSNQSHTLQTSEAGTVTYTDSGTTIEVFEGATPIPFTTGTVVASTFSIATSVTNIVAFNGGNLNSQDTNTTVTTPDHGTMTQSQASIVYTITGKKANGDAFTVTTTQSFSKAIAGSSAESIRLSADSQIFRINQNGTPTPSTITITADRQNVSTSTTFTTNPSPITSTVSGDTLTITHANFSQGGSHTKNTITATAGAVSDEITIVEVREGTDAITSILTNEAHTLNATSAGVVSNFTNSGTELIAYEGANQLTFQKPNTIVTNKNFEATANGDQSEADTSFNFEASSIGSGNTVDIVNIWNVLAQLGVLWVHDVDDNGDYFQFDGTTNGNWAKVQSVVLDSGTTYTVNLADNYEIGANAESNIFLFDFVAFNGDESYQILTGTTSPALSASEFTIEFALYKGLTGTQFPTISGDNTTTGVVEDLTAFSNTLDNGFITYVLKHIKANGEVVRTVKKQSFTKSKEGADGQPGAGGAGVTYRGNYNNNAQEIYNSSDIRKDVVKQGANYYIAKYALADTFNGFNKEPGTSNGADYWETFGAQFTSVATDVLFAEDVYANRTVNIGTGVGGNPVIALNADSASGYANPFISIGQTTQGYDEDGIFMGYDSGTTKFSMRAGTTNALTFDGTAFDYSGTISAGTLNGMTLIGGTISVPDAINPLFSVDSLGNMSAQDANISGSFNINSGKIGNWVIEGTNDGVLRDTTGRIILNPTTRQIQLFNASSELKAKISAEESLSTVGGSDIYVSGLNGVQTYVPVGPTLTTGNGSSQITGTYKVASQINVTITAGGDYVVANLYDYTTIPTPTITATLGSISVSTGNPNGNITYPPTTYNPLPDDETFSQTYSSYAYPRYAYQYFYLEIVDAANNVVHREQISYCYAKGATTLNNSYQFSSNQNQGGGGGQGTQWSYQSGYTSAASTNSYASISSNHNFEISLTPQTYKFRYSTVMKNSNGRADYLDGTTTTTTTTYYTHTTNGSSILASNLDGTVSVLAPANFVELSGGGFQAVTNSDQFVKISRLSTSSNYNTTLLRVDGGKVVLNQTDSEDTVLDVTAQALLGGRTIIGNDYGGSTVVRGRSQPSLRVAPEMYRYSIPSTGGSNTNPTYINPMKGTFFTLTPGSGTSQDHYALPHRQFTNGSNDSSVPKAARNYQTSTDVYDVEDIPDGTVVYIFNTNHGRTAHIEGLSGRGDDSGWYDLPGGHCVQLIFSKQTLRNGNTASDCDGGWILVGHDDGGTNSW